MFNNLGPATSEIKNEESIHPQKVDKIMTFLVMYLLMTQLKPHIQADNHLGHILVGSNLDVKPTYSRNSGPRHVYSKADMLPSTCKVSKLLNLTESSLLVLSFILLAGDINP